MKVKAWTQRDVTIPLNRMIELVPVARVCHIATKPQRAEFWASRSAESLCGRRSFYRGGDDMRDLCVECARLWASGDAAPTGPRIAWQCSGCRWGFADPWQKRCPACGRENYWTGSVHPEAKLWDALTTAAAPVSPSGGATTKEESDG